MGPNAQSPSVRAAGCLHATVASRSAFYEYEWRRSPFAIVEIRDENLADQLGSERILKVLREATVTKARLCRSK